MHRLLICFLIIFTSQLIKGQGCSDAGFCTMGAMKPDQDFISKIKLRLKSLSIGQYIGLTRFHDKILAYTLDLNIGINQNTTFQFKIPHSFTFGPLASTSGFGDISISMTSSILETTDSKINFTVGVKLPTGDGSENGIRGRTLPMYYQQSLGTGDFVIGMSWITDHWLMAVGYQHPFNKIKNTFIWSEWIGTEEGNVALRYPQAIQLDRGNDLMLRIERKFQFSKISFNTALLPIWRLTKDSIILPGSTVETNVGGSDGLALSLLTGATYHVNIRSGIKLMNGLRLIKRKKNPDGLSREFVNTITYVYKF